jgi:hypothetical protein
MRASRPRCWLAGASLGVTLVALGGCGSERANSGGEPATVPPSASTSWVNPPGVSTTATPGPTPPQTPVSPTPPGPPPGASTRSTLPAGANVTIAGIPRDGAEPSCLLLDKYLLIGGDRALLASGATVTVTGHTETGVMSYCQQGIYLVVDSVTRLG